MQAAGIVAPAGQLVPASVPESFSVFPVLPASLDLGMWPLIEPLLAKAVARERGRFTTRHIYHWVKTGEQQLWVVTQGGRCWAAGLVKVYRHPTGKRSATLHLLGGSRAREWALDAWDAWSRACRLDGITELRIVGRKGWARIVGRFGFKPEAVVLTREEI